MPIKYLNGNNTGQANPAGPGSWTTGFNYALNNYAISYGNGYFVATGDGFIARSSNANTWEYKINTSSGVRGVAYGNGLWVAVTGGTGNTGVLYTSSNDGVSWTNLYQPANNYRRGVAYGNSVWVIICDSRSSDKRIFTSTDGSTWTARDSDVIYNSFGITNTISFGGGTFVLVCSSGSSGNTTLCFTSSDGINWTERTLPASTSWKSSAYGNGVWVAVGSGHAARSTDNGATWSSISGRSGSGVTYGDGYFVIAGDSPAYSTDGINWTTISSGPPANSNLTNHIAYGNGIFASVKDTSSSNISTSPMSYIYSQVSPIKFINRNNSGTATPTGNSVQFNGSSQYLSVANNAAFNLSTNNFTAEAWVYLTNSNAQQTIVGQWSGLVGGTTLSWIILTSNDANRYARFLISNNGSGVIGDYISANAIPLNTWSHLALVRNGSAFNLYLNGISVVSTSTSLSVYYATNAITIGATSNPGQFLSGYISNVRVINGTALYTASFTAPTAPLTAIANTSLLTCNAATIVDGSTNNFTITNNNSATVSSTTPFTVAPATSTMKMRKVYSDLIVASGTQKAIFGYGNNGATNYSITNLVSNTGVVANNTTGVGTGRYDLAAAGYGIDKAIFGYGYTSGVVSLTNLVSNTGVVSTDTTGVGTSRSRLAAAGYGSDKAIFGYGDNGSNVSITNLVSNTGVVATDTTGVGTARRGLAAAGYGSDKAIFGYGFTSTYVSMTNLVSNAGVVATDTAGVGTARVYLAAAGYGSDKAIFGYGQTTVALSMTNLVSNTGVVANDTTGVGTVRTGLAAAGYSLT